MDLIFILIGVLIGFITAIEVINIRNHTIGTIKVSTMDDQVELYLIIDNQDSFEKLQKSKKVSMHVERL